MSSRRVLVAMALGGTAALLAHLIAALPIVRSFEALTYDRRLARTAHPQPARSDIAIIEIDEQSLRALEPILGRWPWPRYAHAGVIDFLAGARARVIVYDVLFPERDQLGQYRAGDRSLTGRESDAELVSAVRRAGNVVLLADAVSEDRTPAPSSVPGTVYQPGDGFEIRPSLRLSFDDVTSAAAAVGHNMAPRDPDGVTRSMPPFIEVGSLAVPSLGTAAALIAERQPAAAVRLDGGALRIGSVRMPLIDVAIPADPGRAASSARRVLLRFRGPYADGSVSTYPIYPFYDVLLSEDEVLNGRTPPVDPSVFRDKIVFVGTRAAGTYDVHQTPFRGAAPGMHLHATLTDDILSGHFMTRATSRVDLIAGLVAGLFVGALSVFVRVPWAIAVSCVFAIAVSATLTQQVARGLWIGLIEPLSAAALALFGGVAWQYFVEGRAKRQVKSLFVRYVSKEVFNQLLADPALARLGGRRRDMTVLFSDIRGFTAAFEKGTPESVVAQLNQYFTEMVDVLFRHQGTLDKFVGDMVMGLFGAPVDDVYHADHAVAAAKEMVSTLDRLNAAWASDGRPTLEIGIGINSGEMIAGNIGATTIMSYTVIGDAVNLGSRIESLNKEYGTRILISQATKDRLTTPVETRLIGEVTVKGREQRVVVHEVLTN
jgi:adenylate cyclase